MRSERGGGLGEGEMRDARGGVGAEPREPRPGKRQEIALKNEEMRDE